MTTKRDPAVGLLLEVLKTYSVSMKEAKLSKLLRERMRRRGFKAVRTDKAGNAIGEVGSGHPHVLFCGHMDTVPGFLKVRAEGDRIYGRGAADAKSPMCAMISAIGVGAVPKGMKVTMACVTREDRRQGHRADARWTRLLFMGSPQRGRRVLGRHVAHQGIREKEHGRRRPLQVTERLAHRHQRGLL